MRALLFLAGLGAAAAAHADLYRWVDPQTGSVKLSSVPPPWPVEVVPYRATAAPAPAAQAPPASADAMLETRWRNTLQSLAALAAAGDAESVRAARPQLEAFRALSAELDRVDPEGTMRRRTQAQALLKGARK